MGLASGKLTISHVEDKNKPEAAAEVDLDVSHPVNAAQMVNGDVTNATDLPSIDDDIVEPITSKCNVAAEPVAHGDQAVVVATDTPMTTIENGPNGTVSANDVHTASLTDTEKKEDKPTKKTKNPLVWIQRRLSKRHSTKKSTTDKTTEAEDVLATDESREKMDEAKPSDSAEPTTVVAETNPAEEKQIVETASSLVDQVLNSALVQQLSEASVESEIPEVVPPIPDTVEHEPSTPTTHSEEPQQLSTPSVEVCPPEQAVECAPTEQSQMHAIHIEEATSEVVQELVNGTTEHTESEQEQEVEQQKQPEHTQPEEEEQTVEQVMTETVVDTNNTNAEQEEEPEQHEEQALEQHDNEPCGQQTEGMLEDQSSVHQTVEDQQEPAIHLDADSMAAKLSSLELTNGHSEDHVMTNGEASAEVVVNGN